VKVNLKLAISLVMIFLVVFSVNIKANTEGWVEKWVYESPSSATCVAISSNGHYIAVGTPDGLYLLDGERNFLWDYQTDHPIIDISITADASHIVAAGSSGYYVGGAAYFFNRMGEFEGTVTASTGISSATLSPEGNYFAMTYDNGLGWNDRVALAGEGQWLWYHDFGRSGTADVSISDEAAYGAVGGAAPVFFWEKGGLVFFDKTGNSLWDYVIDTTALSGDKYSVSISVDGKYVAAGNRGNDYLYFFERDQCFIWSYNTGPVEGVSISGDGNYIVAASSSRVFLFDRDKNVLWTSEISNIKDVAISADGNTIVVSTGDGKVYAFRPVTDRVSGIDVSSHQGNINWSQVYNAAGCYRFALVRASWWDSGVDKCFVTNMENADANSMLVGAYHFAYPEYADAGDEARHFFNLAKDYLKEGYLRPALDIEDDESSNSYPYKLGPEGLSNWVQKWMNTVKALARHELHTAVEPMLYVNRNYADFLDECLADVYELWIAHPTCNSNGEPDTKKWNNWVFWQYYMPEPHGPCPDNSTGLNSVPGINGPVDLDVFNGDMSRLNTFRISAWKADSWILFHLCSPADMLVTDPDGLIISKKVNQIPGAAYVEIDMDQDGDLDKEISIPYKKVGYYQITIVPEPNALPDDTYSLDVTIDGETMILAKDVQIQGIPAEPYEVESKLNRCDFDTDGDVDVVDLHTFVLHWLAEDCNYPSWCEGTDLNYSGFIDFIDFAFFANNWLWEKIPADIDIDGDVDFSDYAIFASHWLEKKCSEPNWCARADINKNGQVDILDLGVLAEHWLEGTAEWVSQTLMF